ncbi:MAG: glycosyltransferase family 39 protein [Anaerolineae bacterium]|nr:glycosyltransferase family 39 protein [Anaerolineae bacterium]
MISLVQRLLDPQYLYAIDPGPLGRWSVVYIAWATLLLVGFWGALRWRPRQRTAPASLTAGICLTGLILLGLRFIAPLESTIPSYMRFLLFDVWTARIWPISATLAAIAVPLIWYLSRQQWPAFPQRLIETLAGSLRPEHQPLLLWQTIVLCALHLGGLSWLWHTAHRPWWWSIPSLLLLSILPLLARPRRPRWETLTPLLLSYGVSVVYAIMTEQWTIDLHAYQEFRLPDLWSPWFNISVMTGVGVAYTLWIQCRLIFQHRFPKVLPLAISVFTLVWLLGTVAVHHTYGVTASDPYCYVQMTIDLAQTGSPLHHFPIAELAKELGIQTWPTVHIGYHPPRSDNSAPTMWSIGWPVLMVPFYWLGGLDLLYFVAPLMALLALFTCWFLVNEVLRDTKQPTRWTVAALTCFLVATSPENAERLLVPMADAAAQLFTLLTCWLLLRGRHTRPVVYGFLAGASFGMLYFIRHPQLPLGIAVLVTFFLLNKPLKHKLGLVLAFGLGAGLLAVPDLYYHHTVFGHWLTSESTEWFLLSVNNIGRSFFGILEAGILRREELGFVIPFVFVGLGVLWHRHHQAAGVLASGFLAVLVFHLCYAAIRPRDLIAILPLLYLCAAYGFVTVWKRFQSSPSLPRIIGIICCLVLLFARTSRSLELPWRKDVITFGYISRAQSRAFIRLNDLLPENAIVASMLNSGAIELYTGHTAVHPAPWSQQELDRWLDALDKRGIAFYLLSDGEELAPVLAQLELSYQIEFVARLNLPVFAYGGGNLPQSAVLYRIQAQLP